MPAPKGNQYAAGLTTNGRPTKYKPEFAEQAGKLCALGATDAELATFFKVGLSSIGQWMIQHEDFSRAVLKSKDGFDERVERSLAQRAIGYTMEVTKTSIVRGKKVTIKVVEHVPADTGAAMNWLKNRRRAEWQDAQVQRHEFPTAREVEDAMKSVKDDV